MAKEEKKKVRRPTALKRDLQNEKKRIQNKAFKSSVRTALRAFDQALTTNEKEKVHTQLCKLYSCMDKGVKRGIFKENKAARTKASAAKRFAALTA